MTIRGEGREIHTSVLHFLVRTVGATSESKRKMLRIFFISGRFDLGKEKKIRESRSERGNIVVKNCIVAYNFFLHQRGIRRKKKKLRKHPVHGKRSVRMEREVLLGVGSACD